MYERFYGFRERPFSLLPDPDFLFLSKNHQTALDLLELAVSNHAGFCVISGEIGVGKTTLIRELLNRLDERIQVGLVSNTHASFGELLQWITAAYGLPCGSCNKLELHQRFVDFAIQQYAKNRRTLLIIDEAQNLTADALEELRMLSNVNSDKDFVLQIILVGQQQLRDKLMDPKLEQFAQRIAQDCHISSLGQEETADYIRYRLQHAGGEPTLFSDHGLQAVYQHTDGVPRLINRLCDLCLVYGYSEDSLLIDSELVNRVAGDQRTSTLSCDRYPVASAQPVAAATQDAAGHAPTKVKTVTEKPSPLTESADLHRLAMDTGQQRQAGGGKRTASWLLLGIMVVAGATGWATRELWWQPLNAKLQHIAITAQAIVSEAWAGEAVPAKPREPAQAGPQLPAETPPNGAVDIKYQTIEKAADSGFLPIKNGP